MGLGGVEPPTSPLSGVRSNQLSYRPAHLHERLRSAVALQELCVGARQGVSPSAVVVKGGDPAAGSPTATLLRLHPSHEPHRGRRPPRKVKLPASGTAHSHGVTGGVYKARERIHRGSADPRLLAIPTSRSRVADSDPDYERL